MSPKSLIVIGAGPGGYAAALEAAQRGLAVTLIDAQEMGGTCLNRGCIPSKFFLAHAKPAAEAFTPIVQLVHEKDTVLATLRQRMEQAAKSASVRRITGTAALVSAQEVEVTTAQGKERLKADAIVLATGSSPIVPASFPRHPAVFTSDTIFAIDYLPAHLVVVGGGYIGCELACAFQGLGSKVTLIEKEKSLLATQPEFLAAAPVLQRSFEKRGMTVWTGTEVKTVVPADSKKLLVTCSNDEPIEANALLFALGRRPNVQGLGLEAAGVVLQNGRIQINELMQTSVPSASFSAYRGQGSGNGHPASPGRNSRGNELRLHSPLYLCATGSRGHRLIGSAGAVSGTQDAHRPLPLCRQLQSPDRR